MEYRDFCSNLVSLVWETREKIRMARTQWVNVRINVFGGKVWSCEMNLSIAVDRTEWMRGERNKLLDFICHLKCHAKFEQSVVKNSEKENQF